MSALPIYSCSHSLCLPEKRFFRFFILFYLFIYSFLRILILGASFATPRHILTYVCVYIHVCVNFLETAVRVPLLADWHAVVDSFMHE